MRWDYSFAQDVSLVFILSNVFGEHYNKQYEVDEVIEIGQLKNVKH